MEVVKKKGGEGTVILEATAKPTEVNEALRSAGVNFCRQMGLQPDPAKSPRQIAAEQMGVKDLDSVVRPAAIKMLVPPAIDKSGVNPAFTPDAQPATPLARNQEFKFTVNVTLKPSYELPDYSPITMTVDPYEVDEEAVDKQIAEMAKNFVKYETTDPHPVAPGDICLMKIECSKDGEVIEALSTDTRSYIVGGGFMPPTFDTHIHGMDVGETRSFSFEAPSVDVHGSEINEMYDATVTLLEVQKEVMPVIDDAWIAENLPAYRDLEDLRSAIRSNLDVETRASYQDYLRNVAASEISKRFDGKISDEIYDGTQNDMMTNLRYQVAASNMTWDQFVKQQGGEQQFQFMMMVQVRHQLIQGFSLDAVYRHEGLSYTEEDLDDVCRAMNPYQPEEMRKQMESDGYGYALREAAERFRACNYLVEHATIIERDPDAEEEEGEDATAEDAPAEDVSAENAPTEDAPAKEESAE